MLQPGTLAYTRREKKRPEKATEQRLEKQKELERLFYEPKEWKAQKRQRKVPFIW